MLAALRDGATIDSVSGNSPRLVVNSWHRELAILQSAVPGGNNMKDREYKAKVCVTPVGPCVDVQSNDPVKTVATAVAIGVGLYAGAQLVKAVLR